MTYREKFIKEHSGSILSGDRFIEFHCPHQYYPDAVMPDFCRTDGDASCVQCWNREVPEELDSVGDRETKETDMTPIDISTPTIKDSGDRTEFASGAVRDMREGKGRCDLVPLEVAAEWLKDDILGCIAQFRTHGTTTFLYGALNYFSEKAFAAPYGDAKATTLLEVAKHFEEGAKKYGESNWQKGIPVHCYIDSAIRHYLKWRRGDKDEPHDRAFVWNLMCCIWEVDFHDYGG